MVLERFDPQEWVSAKTAAHTLRFSLQWVRELGRRGEIGTLQTDLGTLYRRADVERIGGERASKTAA